MPADHPPVDPVSVVIAGQPCLVAGCGPAAARKIVGLSRARAHVTVVAPRIEPDVERIASAHRTFLLPVIDRGGSITVAAPTGASPALATWLRHQVAQERPAGCSTRLRPDRAGGRRT